MKLFILLSLVLLATSAMANKKCVDMINSSDHTLKMVKHESQTMTEYKEDSLDLYLKVETENRNSDYFQTLKMNLCDSVTSTIEHWNDTHKALASFLNQVEEMIDFRGCKMKKDLLFDALLEVNKEISHSKATLNEFALFYRSNLDHDLNCML